MDWDAFSCSFLAINPRPVTGVSGTFGPEASRERPQDSECAGKGVPEGVSHEVSRAFQAPECLKGVLRVSPGVKQVSWTLLGLSRHLLETPEPGAQRGLETPRGTLRSHLT